MKKVVIDRTRWVRGGVGQLADRNRENCCCLSFVANQLCGIPWNDMRGKDMPSKVKGMQEKDTECLLVSTSTYSKCTMDTTFGLQAAETNDAPWMEDDEREADLIDLFHDEDIKLEFIN